MEDDYKIKLNKMIYSLIKQNKLTPSAFERKCNLGRGFVSNLLSNNTSVFNLIKISNTFNVSIDYILGLTDVKEIITSDTLRKNIPLEDKQLITQYHNLSSNNKSIVDYILEMKEESIEMIQEDSPNIIYKFPVYEQQAAAGAGITGRDGKFTMENIFTDDIPQNAVFGVHIKGESMINTDPTLIIEDIPDNSFVLLNPKVSVSDLNKTIVVASINNEVICKYFLIEQDGIHFYSLNRKEHADDDRFAKSPDECKIIGQVVKVIKPNEHE